LTWEAAADYIDALEFRFIDFANVAIDFGIWKSCAKNRLCVFVKLDAPRDFKSCAKETKVEAADASE
jgi:hypothetical protein